MSALARGTHRELRCARLVAYEGTAAGVRRGRPLISPQAVTQDIMQQLLVAAAAEGGKIFALRRSLSRGLHTRVRGIQSGGRALRKAYGAQKKIARPRFARSGR